MHCSTVSKKKQAIRLQRQNANRLRSMETVRGCLLFFRLAAKCAGIVNFWFYDVKPEGQ